MKCPNCNSENVYPVNPEVDILKNLLEAAISQNVNQFISNVHEAIALLVLVEDCGIERSEWEQAVITETEAVTKRLETGEYGREKFTGGRKMLKELYDRYCRNFS